MSAATNILSIVTRTTSLLLLLLHLQTMQRPSTLLLLRLRLYSLGRQQKYSAGNINNNPLHPRIGFIANVANVVAGGPSGVKRLRDAIAEQGTLAIPSPSLMADRK